MTDKILQPWKPLTVGQRVIVNCRYRCGDFGIVKERLDDRIDGMGRYGVTLDGTPNLTTDYCRHELSRVQ